MSRSRHLIVTRFAVPRPEGGTAETYLDPEWLEARLELFRRFYVPSVAPLGIPAVLLCGSRVADLVARRIADLEWARLEVQDDWRGGWRGEPDQVLTRFDSDDALHREWFEAVDRAPASAAICITKEFLRWDPDARRLHYYRRREPSPLAAFRHGANPYELDHKYLERAEEVHRIRGAYLLQVAHGANLKNRRPSAWRLHRLRPRSRLAAFGLEP
ncbi:MAG: putative rhamnosyl transferase [Holophagales bacterium]|nr:putative rhamnosyl transferase [Holophagales bacterium]